MVDEQTAPPFDLASIGGLGVANEAKGHGMTEWTKPEYRVVRDNYNGYEVQIRRWWHWPFWWQAAGSNTHSSVEAAETFAEGHARARGPVKHLGRLGA